MEMITVLYTHQSKKLELELDPERPISHLMDRLEEITDVPVGNMKGTFCRYLSYIVTTPIKIPTYWTFICTFTYKINKIKLCKSIDK